MLKLASVSRAVFKKMGDPGVAVHPAKKTGRVRQRMGFIKKGHHSDEIKIRPDHGSKEWIHLQYADNYVAKPDIVGHIGSKK